MGLEPRLKPELTINSLLQSALAVHEPCILPSKDVREGTLTSSVSLVQASS